MDAIDQTDFRVLVVDDDNQLLRTLSDILRLHGYATQTASNGKDGLALAGADAPVIALVDLRLPDMDGMELVSLLKANSSTTEVVILTGNASVDSAVRALRNQSFDYLVKPVRPDELFRTLERAGERFFRRRAEAALRESEDQMHRIFSAVNDGLVITDANGITVQVNPAAARITGVAPDDLNGMDIAALFRATENPPEQQPGTREIRFTRPDGEERSIEIEVKRFAPNRLVHVVRDVTEQRHTQEQLRLAQKMEALGRLAGGVAHDFNNVLTAIRGYAELAGERSTDPALSDEIDEIRRAADRAGDLTRQLLAFSRRQVLQPKLLSLGKALTGMEGMLRRLIREDIRMQLIAPPAEVWVKADPTQLEQVILNLVVNARDAMPDGGTVTIHYGVSNPGTGSGADNASGAWAYVSFSDTGDGIPSDVMPHVFEPFFTTKPSGQGTGLGLSTVHGIVHQLGGFIRVESCNPRGTSFTVWLPQEHRPESDAGQTRVIAPASNGGTERILVTEDDPAIRRMIVRCLTRQGYTVLDAGSATQALDIVSRGEPIDLLLTDLVLPDFSGWELARRTAELHAGLRVLYMSGYAEGEFGDIVVGPGSAFLAKPFLASDLTRRIRAILDGEETAAPVKSIVS